MFQQVPIFLLSILFVSVNLHNRTTHSASSSLALLACFICVHIDPIYSYVCVHVQSDGMEAYPVYLCARYSVVDCDLGFASVFGANKDITFVLSYNYCRRKKLWEWKYFTVFAGTLTL